MPDIIAHHVERPDCNHMQTIMARASDSVADYQQRLIPELKESIKEPCEQCIKRKHLLKKNQSPNPPLHGDDDNLTNEQSS